METLKYKVITTRKQYDEYCKEIYSLLKAKKRTKEVNEEIDLLTVLIEKWDREHNTFRDLDPVELIKALMEEHRLEPGDLMKILGVSKGMISGILNYHKGLSKENIQILASHFKMAQEAFNRNYKLRPRMISIGRVIKTKKKLTSHSNRGLVHA